MTETRDQQLRQSERTAMRRIGYVAAVGYIATIFAANWLIQHVGLVHVGFGLMAPAGVFAAGLALTFRDVVQRTLGRTAVVVAILVGASLSYLVSPAFALASGVAFLLSEFADFAVYTPLERRSWLGAIALSNTVGAVIDSALFLWIAFGSLDFFWGQFVGKTYTTIAAVIVLSFVRVKRTVHGDEAALELIRRGELAPADAPLAVLRDMQKRQGK